MSPSVTYTSKRETDDPAYFRELCCNGGLDVRDLCIVVYLDGDGETPCEGQGFASGRYFDGNHRQNVHESVMIRRPREAREATPGRRNLK